MCWEPYLIAYAIYGLIAGIMLIRRDVTVEDWSDPVEGQYGVRATTLVRLRHTTKQRITKTTNINLAVRN